MRETRIIFLIAALWLVGSVVDVILLPSANYSVVYVVPVVLAATQASPRAVGVTAGVVLLTDLFDIYQAHLPPEIWTVTLLSLVVICAMSVWIAVIRQRLVRSAREQQAVTQSAEALVRTPTLDQVAAVIAEQAQAILDVAAIHLWEADRERGESRLIAARGVGATSEGQPRRIPFDAPSLLNQVLHADEILEVEDLSSLAPDLTVTRALVTREGFHSLLAQPLNADGQVVGAITYFTRVPRHFSAHDQALIRPLGNLWALAIENAHLHDQALQNARHAEAARESLQGFLAMVAHDLRNPLTTVLGYTQLLIRSESARQSQKALQDLSAIEQSALQMRRLVGDVLDASRIGAGHFEIQPEEMDLVALARRIVEQVGKRSTTHALSLVAPESLKGVWDPVRLQQVLENLLSNAVKYSPSGTEVVVRVNRQDDKALVSVTDHGEGLSPEQIQQLFRPFSRPAHAQEAKGIGLGLYLTKGIVEAMHGCIRVESTVGKGSTFSVVLPIRLLE